MKKSKVKKIVIIIVILLPIVLIAISGRRTNPPVENQVNWDSQATRDQFYSSCADCHSHETKWPWYSYVAPVSWLVISDVNEAREHFNISESDMGEAYEAAHEVEEGEMPLPIYLKMHPEARMSAEEEGQFIAGLEKTFGTEEDEDEHDDEDDEDEHEDHEH